MLTLNLAIAYAGERCQELFSVFELWCYLIEHPDSEATMPSIHGILRRTYNGTNKLLARLLLRKLATFNRGRLRLERLGQGDGAWIVPVDLIRENSICYCVGVGDDASFDIALAHRSARVFSFDPTPRSVKYMEHLDYDQKRMTFLPVGIWNENTALKLYAPMNRQHINLSVRDIHGTGEFFEVKCRRLRDVMTDLGHDHLDLLKLDIEGAWFEVLEDLINEKVSVSVLCVEFDSPTSLIKSLHTIRNLERIGLKMVNQDRDNFLFVQEALITVAAN